MACEFYRAIYSKELLVKSKMKDFNLFPDQSPPYIFLFYRTVIAGLVVLC